MHVVHSVRRRILTVLFLAVGLFGATLVPAYADFSVSTSAATTIGTATVAAPGSVGAQNTFCYWISTTRISWTPSNARAVTGYTVRAYAADGSSSVVSRKDAGSTSATYTSIESGRPYRFSVTTETAYGWTAESAPSAAVTC
jgi:hypothetical protein